MLSNFFRRPHLFNASAVAVAEPEAPLVTAPVDLKRGDIELETEYRRVAEKLQVARRPGTSWRRLAEVLEELMIPVYDLEKVKAFLDKKALQVSREEAANAIGGRASWYWWPLRAPDIDPMHAELMRANKGTPPGMLFSYPPQGGVISWGQYGKAVPLPALLTAERIEDRLPGEVNFYLSDVQRFPDPFLAVQLRADTDKTLFVVERWDEPGFRG